MDQPQLLLEVPERLETSRLLLEPYRPGDGAWLHAIFAKNSVHLAASIEEIRNGLGLDLTSPQQAEIFVRQLWCDWAARRRFVFAVWENESRSFVGDIWVESLDWSGPLCEIGYFVVEDHLGKGYATEAAQAGLAFIFNDLMASKVRVITDADNVGSYRVAERCGFVLEGRLRAVVKRSDGTLVDKLYYGLLRSEFEARQG